MSQLNARVERLYPALSARERIVLILEAANDEREPEPRIRETMPNDQVGAFNHYLGQLRGANRPIGSYVLVFVQEVAHARTQLLLLSALAMWGTDRSALLDYIAFNTNQPCTQAEFDEHLAEARAEDLSLDDAVDAVIEARGLSAAVAAGNPATEHRRFRQVSRPIEAELRALVANKALVGGGRGTRLAINAGSFYDWLGQPTPVPPEWGHRYEVVAAEEAAWRHESWKRMRARAKSGPHAPTTVLAAFSPTRDSLLPDDSLSEHDVRMRTLAERLRRELLRLSGAVGALDAVLDEVRGNLGGHDAVHPMVRGAIERARAELAELREHAALLVGAIESTEPDGEVLETLRALVHDSAP